MEVFVTFAVLSVCGFVLELRKKCFTFVSGMGWAGVAASPEIDRQALFDRWSRCRSCGEGIQAFG